MTGKIRVFMLSVIAVITMGAAHAQVPVSGCPESLQTLASWYETNPDFGDIVEISMTLTFTNSSGVDITFDASPDETIQVWSTPGVLDPSPLVFNSWPSGTVLNGADYSYDITAGIADLPVSEDGFGIRPQSITLGTMSPANAALVSAEFSCVAGVRGSTPIPVLSSWSRITLLLLVAGSALLLFRRRLS